MIQAIVENIRTSAVGRETWLGIFPVRDGIFTVVEVHTLLLAIAEHSFTKAVFLAIAVRNR